MDNNKPSLEPTELPDVVKQAVGPSRETLQNLYPVASEVDSDPREADKLRSASSPKKKKHHWVKIILLVIISLFVLNLTISKATILIKNHTASSQIIEQRQAAEITGDQKLAERTKALLLNGTVDAVLASSKIDVCYTDADNVTFTTADWYQECYIRYVEGFTTNLSEKEVRERFAFQSYNPTEIPNLVPSSIGPGVRRVGSSYRIFHTFQPEDISTERNQVWISFDEEYFHQTLPCGGLFFCDNPREKPIHPEL